jgi:hypothetical protein
MGKTADQPEPDFSRPPVVISQRRDTKSLVRKRAIFLSSVLSTVALFVVTVDVRLFYLWSSDYDWGLSSRQTSAISIAFLFLLPLLATLRQCFIKPADIKVIWNAFVFTTLLLVGPFSMLYTNGNFTFDFQRLGLMFIGYVIGLCLIEVLGMGCELVLKIFWNWFASLNFALKRTKKPPLQVATEAQELTEVEPTVSNQQSH